MDSTEDVKLLYLLSGSCNVLPSSYLKLRSYLNVHLSNLADQHNLKVLKSFRNRNKTCPYCYSPWSGRTTSFKLLPSKRFRKLQMQSDGSKLNEPRNTLVLKCKVCSKKSSFSLVKKKHVETKVTEQTMEFKKKKKKKDKTCGLNVNLLKPEDQTPEGLFVKKKKRRKDLDFGKQELSDEIQSSFNKNTPNSKSGVHLAKDSNKKLVPNPFANQIQNLSSKKQDKKLKRLKEAVKQDKSLVKKTLKDFLTLV